MEKTFRKIRTFVGLGIFLLGGFLNVTQTSAADSPLKSAEFFDAARSGDLATLKSGAANRALLTATNEKGHTAFVLAAYYGHLEAARELLRAGSDACVKDEKGNTALMGSIFKGEDAIFDLLLAKCDVNTTNLQGQTALMYAALFGRDRMAKELLRVGADATKRDLSGRQAIQLAESQWNQVMAALLRTARVIR